MRLKIMIATTVDMSLRTYLRGQPRFLSHIHDICLVTSPGPGVNLVRDTETVPVHPIPMTRRITPLHDVVSVFRMMRLIRRERPDIVHSYTPKAGLVAMLAAAMMGVPCRIHTVLGLPLMEAKGMRRHVLAIVERITHHLATHVTANGAGLQEYLNHHLNLSVDIIGEGSVDGIDCNHFRRGAAPTENVARSLGLHPGDRVIVYIGRLVRDKGVDELLAAFVDVQRNVPHARLVMVGPHEGELDPIGERSRALLNNHPSIRTPGFQVDVRPYLELADVCVLPSYREGLPNILLEAAAMGVPVVATDIPGCREVVVHRSTGLLVPAKEAEPLSSAIRDILEDPEVARRIGEEARRRVSAKYGQSKFRQSLAMYYEKAYDERTRRKRG